MSELLSAIHWTPPPAKVRDAAAVILVRGSEVFWVRRGERLAFFGGFYAFPGGKLDEADGQTPIENCPPGEEALRVCALRETFEETGILLAPGAPPAGRLDGLRRELLGGASFAELLRREGIRLDGSVLRPAGRWVTPEFAPVRFDARFFVAEVPAGTEGSIDPGELADGGFIRPAEALARWEAGTALLHPPNHHALATLARLPVAEALPLLQRPPGLGADHVARRIEFQRGIHFAPLRTLTLPPATHTNAYVIGTDELLVVDPGTDDPAELDALEALVRALGEPRAVLLTHHHRDHSAGAVDLARRLGVALWASASTASRVPGAEGRLVDGMVLQLRGPRPFQLACLLTEGHARGHLCFRDQTSAAVVCGDMVANGSTIVVDPPEGDMGDYLASLRRLRGLSRTLYPAHGFPIPDGTSRIDEYLTHREARLEAIAAAVTGGVGDLGAIVELVYADVPAFLHPAAERSALASLLELEKRGRARRRDERTWI